MAVAMASAQRAEGRRGWLAPYPRLAAALLLLVLHLRAGSCLHTRRRSLSQHADQPSCGISQLGYCCYLQVCPKIALHWTLGGPPPGPNCQYSNNTATDPASAYTFNAATDLIHFALVTDLEGYVAMSLPQELGVMAPADAIIGLYGGSVEAYHLKDHHHFPVDQSVRLQNLQTSNTPGKGLTVCASRSFAAVGAAGGSLTLDGPVGMNFAAYDHPELKRHRMEIDHRCSTAVWLKATAHSGAEHSAEPMHATDTRPAVVAHAVLMVLAWLLLLPSGILAARHKWLFAEASGAKSAAWFVWHRALQVTGLLCFGVAFLLPWFAFGQHTHGGGEMSALPKVHGAIGITLACLASLQLLLALLRPKPEAQIRRWWNLQHWYTGRVAIVLAVVNILLGVQIFHEMWQVSRVPWYTAVCVLAGAAASIAIWMEVKKGQRDAWTLAPTRPEIDLGDRRHLSSNGGRAGSPEGRTSNGGAEGHPLLYSR